MFLPQQGNWMAQDGHETTSSLLYRAHVLACQLGGDEGPEMVCLRAPRLEAAML